MDSPAEERARPVRRRLRRVLVVLLWIVGIVEALYVGGGLFLVKSGQVERWINTHPEKLRVSFDSVWPIVPGVVRVRGFRIVNQGRGDQLEGRVDRVWGAIDPLELPAGRLHIVWLRCRGVTFRLRNRPADAEEAAKPPVGLPPIEGVAWEPFAGSPPAPAKKKKAGLKVIFTRAHLDDVREVWIGERSLRGPGTVVASVTIVGDGRLAIPYADVRFDGATIENGKEESYTGVQMRVLGKMPVFDPKEAKGGALVSLIRARVDVKARMPSGARYLNAYLKNAPWIRFDGGEANLSAQLAVGDGRLAPGGFIELSSTDRQAEVAGFAIRGKARTRLDVVPAAGDAAEARLVVAFEDYDLRRRKDDPAPVMKGKGFRIVAATPATLGVIPPSELSGRLELGKAEFPRLDFVNVFVPAGGGLRFRGGKAKVEGAFDVAGSGSSCKGSMKVTAVGLSVDTGDVGMVGALSLALKVPRGDLLKQTFDVDGTRLDLERFTFESKNEAATAPDWSASVAFPKAHLAFGGAFSVGGEVVLQASDSRPVVAFLSKDAPLSGWKKKLVTVGEIKGGGRASLSPETLEVADFSVGWGKTEIRARFRTTPEGAVGKALLRVGILKAGVGLAGKDRHVQILRPEHWFGQP